MKYITNYKDDDVLREKFNELTRNVFGFDFEAWYEKGFWDDRYLCHSYLKDDEIISNVSCTKFDLVIRDENYRAMQIGTVMSHPDFRGQGLGVELTARVLEKYKDEVDFFYLFGHGKVWDYYEKQGFTPVKEHTYSINRSPVSVNKMDYRNLNIDVEEDLKIIKRLTRKRVPVSKTMGVIKDTAVFLFYCQIAHGNNLYYFPEIDLLLVLEKEEKKIHIHDLLSVKEISFGDIEIALNSIFDDFEEICFQYTPEYDDIEMILQLLDSGDRMFFKGDISILPEVFLYPPVAHT